MAFGARIVEDSMSLQGVRLTTFEITHPRYILAEVNTHRMLSRNSASSRAIPVATVLQRLKDDPYTPVYWGSNKKGMQAGEELDEATQKLCLQEWLAARDDAMKHAAKLRELGLHKQDANRLLEPFMWNTALLTATEWDNFFHLRNHPDAHPAFQTVATMMQELYDNNEPFSCVEGDWHVPFIDENKDISAVYQYLTLNGEVTAPSHQKVQDLLLEVGVGRCARVSHLTHDGKRDIQADIALTEEKLTPRGHMSLLEHAARPATEADMDLALFKKEALFLDDTLRLTCDPSDMWFGNFRGWVQYRKLIPGEADILGYRNQVSE